MTDWPRLIRDLGKTGMSDAEIGARIGITGKAVNKLKNGGTVEPLHSTGAALLTLYERVKNAGLIGSPIKELG